MINKDLKGMRLLVMGGMRISCEIIRKAQELGVVVGVADYNTVEDSPGKKIADEHYEVSITDVDAVVELIKKEKFDGVFVGFNDMLLPFYAEICRKANLPCYGTKEQFEVLISKDKYKSLCRDFNVPTIEEYSINDTTIKYPVLVKPCDSSGSRGITICHSNEELKVAYETALNASKTKKALIERYMDGREVTVFWVFQNCEYYLAGLANRHVKKNQGEDIIPLPVGYTFPSVFLSKYREDVEENCKRMFHELNIQNGMMFMQCKVEDGTCYVYDIGYRLTGSLEYKILERVCGYNPLEMMICYALTGDMGEPNLKEKANPLFETPAFNVSCLSLPGTIKSITGIDEVKQFPQVIDAVMAHVSGETITEKMRGLLAQITIRVLGTANDKAELLPVMQKINNTIHIIGTNGNELMLPGIEFSDIDGYLL